MKRRLALLLHHAGTAPDLIYPSLIKISDLEVVTFYIKSSTNHALNNLYDNVIGTIGPGVECLNEEDMYKKVVDCHERHPINGVLTFAEMLLQTTSKILRDIDLPYMDEDIINNLQNKILQRKVLFENHVPCPNFIEIKKVKDIDKAVSVIGFPALLKPNFGGGGYGIIRVNNCEELIKAYDYEQKNYENIILENVPSTFTLEELMIGESWNRNSEIADYCSVESIIQNGEIIHLTVSDRTKLVPPFRESGYISPTNLSEDKVKLLEEVTTQALKALELNNIMTHTELKFTKEGPKIIEVNGRPGGTVPFRIKNATNGKYDLFIELAKLALGESVETNIAFEKYAASKVSHCPEGKWLIKEIGFEAIRKINSVQLMIPIKGSGEKVDSYRGIEDILGLYYLENEDYNILVDEMTKIDKVLEVNYESI